MHYSYKLKVTNNAISNSEKMVKSIACRGDGKRAIPAVERSWKCGMLETHSTSTFHSIRCHRQPRSHAPEFNTYPKSSKELGTVSDQKRHGL